MEPKPIFHPPQLSDHATGSGAVFAFVLISAIGNVAGTWFFSDIRIGSISEVMACFAFGLMSAQPCALAVWCAMGDQKLIVRAPLTMGILFFLVSVYVGALYAMSNSISMPLEVPVILNVAAFAVAFLIQLPLWVFRLKTGYRLSLQGTQKDSEDDAQFGIKHLLIATTIAAVIVAISRYAFQGFEFEGGAPWGQIIPFFVAFQFFMAAITLLIVALVFSRKRIAIACLLALVVIIGPAAVISIIDTATPGGIYGRAMQNSYAFTFALTSALSVVLVAFYGIGYRLQRTGD